MTFTTRITEGSTVRQTLRSIQEQRRDIDRIGADISSGIKVRAPGDSNQAGTIATFRSTLDRFEGYKNRLVAVESFLVFQDDAIKNVQEVINRAQEIATQAANETNGPTIRAQMAEEVWQIRENLIQLANSTYQGRYVFHGGQDDTPPYGESITPYTNPASGEANRRFVYSETSALGSATVRTVKISDDLSIAVNTAGNAIFDQAVASVERLGRALAGFRTTPLEGGTPDGGGDPYGPPNAVRDQTIDIRTALDGLSTARDQLQIERVSLGGKLRRVETAQSLLNLNKTSAAEALDKLQSTDVAEAATQLSLAQNALQASLTVSSRVLNLSILDYL